MRGIVLSVALATIALLATTARAEQHVNPCKADTEKLCKDTPAGGGQRLACLDQHRSELSAGCQAYLDKKAARQARRHERGQPDPNRAAFSACNEDLKKFCSGVPAGRGVLMRCLEQHESALSPNCKTAVSGRKAAK